MIRSSFPLILAGLALAPSTASAHEGFWVDAGWRATLRRAYVFNSTDTDQIPLYALVAGREPRSELGVANSYTELGRFEGSLHYGLTEDLSAFAQVTGGHWQLQFAPDLPLHEGTDWSFDVGGSITRPFNDDFRFETIMAGRVRVWTLGEDVPLHGNVGLVLGVRPEYKGFSLLAESTLAAVWLTDLTAWGAQKDSSILRIRPEYTWHHGRFSFSGGLDYYHTHTEFFGTELVPGHEAFMLDDFDLALVLGTEIEL